MLTPQGMIIPHPAHHATPRTPDTTPFHHTTCHCSTPHYLTKYHTPLHYYATTLCPQYTSTLPHATHVMTRARSPYVVSSHITSLHTTSNHSTEITPRSLHNYTPHLTVRHITVFTTLHSLHHAPHTLRRTSFVSHITALHHTVYTTPRTHYATPCV